MQLDPAREVVLDVSSTSSDSDDDNYLTPLTKLRAAELRAKLKKSKTKKKKKKEKKAKKRRHESDSSSSSSDSDSDDEVGISPIYLCGNCSKKLDRFIKDHLYNVTFKWRDIVPCSKSKILLDLIRPFLSCLKNSF